MKRVSLDEVEVGKYYLFEFHDPPGPMKKARGRCNRIERYRDEQGNVHPMPVMSSVAASGEKIKDGIPPIYIYCTEQRCPKMYVDTKRTIKANKHHVGPRVRGRMQEEYQDSVNAWMNQMQRRKDGTQRSKTKRRRTSKITPFVQDETFRAPW